MKKVFLFFYLVFVIPIFSQENEVIPNYNDSLITIKGKVVDTTKTVGFYNVMVVNKTAGKGIFGEYNGTFSITVKKSDLVAISVTGYKTEHLSYKDKVYKKEYEVIIYLKLNEFTSEEVEVKPLKTLKELQEERASISKREVPQVTISSAIQSPITALYVAFSKREKTKRMIAELEYQDQKRDIVKEILRVYVHNDIIALNEEDFDSFIIFLNLNERFLKEASDYELIIYIKDKFEHYQKMKE